MKHLGIMFWMFVVLSAQMNGQDMRGNAARSLFSDHKAARVGDAVTIVVVETSSASNAAQTTSSRQSNVGLNVTQSSGATGGIHAAFQIGHQRYQYQQDI